MTQEFGPIREAQGRGIHPIDVHRLAVRVGAPEGRVLSVLDLQSGSILVGPRRHYDHFVARVIDGRNLLAVEGRVLSANGKVRAIDKALDFTDKLLLSLGFRDKGLFFLDGEMELFGLDFHLRVSACAYNHQESATSNYSCISFEC